MLRPVQERENSLNAKHKRHPIGMPLLFSWFGVYSQNHTILPMYYDFFQYLGQQMWDKCNRILYPTTVIMY
jgi:hypothetical protein